MKSPDTNAQLSNLESRRQLESASAPDYPQASLYNAPESEGFDVHRLIAVVLRRWPVMLGVFAASLAIGIATNTLTKPIYQAAAKIELIAPQRGAGASQIPGLEGFSDAALGSSIDTQIETLRDGALQNRARAQLSARDQGVLKGFGPIGIIQVGTTNLVAVAVQSYDADAAAALSNALCREFIAASLDKNRANSRGAVRYVEDQLKTVRGNLSDAQAKLKNYKEQTHIFSISDQAAGLSTQLATLQQSAAAAQSERAASGAKLKGLQGVLSQLPANRVVPAGLAPNPAVANLQSQLTQLELARTISLREYTPTSYKVKAIDAQIEALRAQLQQQAKTLISGWQPDPRRAPLANDAAQTQSQMWAMDARISALNQQTAQARAALDRLPAQEFRYTQLATEVQVLQQAYQDLNQRLQNLKIGEEAKVADARLISAAEANPKPIAPNKAKTLIYALILGILGAFATAIALDMLDTRIYSDDEAQRLTGLPVLSHVPFARGQGEMSLLSALATKPGAIEGAPPKISPQTPAKTPRTSPLLESFRMLRANIAFSAVDNPVRTLVVTSSVPNEGKSTSAFNLAAAAATDGERVVLVDLDLRRPTVHDLCKVPNRVGFSSVALGRATLEEALQASGVPNLQLLTSGPVPPNPFKLLQSQSARAVIAELGKNADFIVIDTPPMLGMADARLIASWVDGTLLVVSCREAARREIARAADLLAQSGIETLGIVLTKVPTGSDGYSYGYHGYHQYGAYLEADAGENDDKPALAGGLGE